MLDFTFSIYYTESVFKETNMTLREYLSQKRGASVRLAKALEVSVSYLSQLASGVSPISPARCVQIEKETGGAVTRKEMRDDWKQIWPELDVPLHPMRRKTDSAKRRITDQQG